MILREMRRADGPELLDQLRKNFGDEFEITGKDPAHFLEVIDRATSFPYGWLWRLLRLLGVSPAHMYIGEEQGHIVGATFVTIFRTHGYLSMVMTDPAHRNQGIARQVLDRAEGTVRRRHRAWAVLDVRANNDPALRIYNARGYRPLRTQYWLFRPLDAPREAFRNAPQVRPMTKPDLPRLLSLYSEQQPDAVRKILAPERSHLSPAEQFQRVLAAQSASWCIGPVGAPTGFLRATFTTAKEAGNLSLPLLDPASSSVERSALLETALAWLAGLGVRRVLVEVPAYATDALTLLKEAGFTVTQEITTMALPLTRAAG